MRQYIKIYNFFQVFEKVYKEKSIFIIFFIIFVNFSALVKRKKALIITIFLIIFLFILVINSVKLEKIKKKVIFFFNFHFFNFNYYSNYQLDVIIHTYFHLLKN